MDDFGLQETFGCEESKKETGSLRWNQNEQKAESIIPDPKIHLKILIFY
jgi:hypothetical protein